MCIRPEQILAAGGETHGLVPLGALQVEQVSFFGIHHRCLGRHVKSNIPMIIRLPQNRAAAVGERLKLFVNREDIVLLRHYWWFLINLFYKTWMDVIVILFQECSRANPKFQISNSR